MATRTFRDESGREWAVQVSAWTLKRIKRELGEDAYKQVIGGFQGMMAVVADPVMLVDVLYLVCKEEADERHVTDEAFGRCLRGEAVNDAAETLLRALADFTPDAMTRDKLHLLIDKASAVQEELVRHSADEIDAIDAAAVARKLIADRIGQAETPGS